MSLGDPRDGPVRDEPYEPRRRGPLGRLVGAIASLIGGLFVLVVLAIIVLIVLLIVLL